MRQRYLCLWCRVAELRQNQLSVVKVFRLWEVVLRRRDVEISWVCQQAVSHESHHILTEGRKVVRREGARLDVRPAWEPREERLRMEYALLLGTYNF